MKILHLTPYMPNVNAIHAGGVCMGKEYETLKENNTVFQLYFYQKKYNEKPTNNGVPLNTVKKIISVLFHPFIAHYFATRSSFRMRKKIEAIIEREHINAIHAEYTSMAQYASLVKRKYPSIKFNIVLHDVTSQGYARKLSEAVGIKKIYFLWQYKLILSNEKKWLSKCDHILVFTQKDAKLVQYLYKLNNINIINTYFDLERKLQLREPRQKDNKFSIGFMGQMARMENETAALRLINIFKKINVQYTNTFLHIIGNGPSKRIYEESANNPNIIITGFVEDPDTYIKKYCDIMVFPLIYGAGIKIKVLTSMSLGLPTITTAIGAEGIDDTGIILTIANSDSEITKAILKYLSSHDNLITLGKMNKKFIKENFSWKKTERVFKKIYE